MAITIIATVSTDAILSQLLIIISIFRLISMLLIHSFFCQVSDESINFSYRLFNLCLQQS
jgi:hypothetical protein